MGDFFDSLQNAEISAQVAGVIDFILPFVLMYFGFKWLRNPPEYMSGKGFIVKYSRVNYESWYFAQRLGSAVYMVEGVLALAFAIWKYKAYSLDEPMKITVIYTVMLIAMGFMPLLIIQIVGKAKFSDALKQREEEEAEGLWILREEEDKPKAYDVGTSKVSDVDRDDAEEPESFIYNEEDFEFVDDAEDD